jgi:hypothetical protein
VEDFSLDRLRTLDTAAIRRRIDLFAGLVRFEPPRL